MQGVACVFSPFLLTGEGHGEEEGDGDGDGDWDDDCASSPVLSLPVSSVVDLMRLSRFLKSTTCSNLICNVSPSDSEVAFRRSLLLGFSFLGDDSFTRRLPCGVSGELNGLKVALVFSETGGFWPVLSLQDG